MVIPGPGWLAGGLLLGSLTAGGYDAHLYAQEGDTPERFEMEASDPVTIERYLTAGLGDSIRSQKRFPMIFNPVTPDQMAPSWQTGHQNHREPLALIDPSGAIRCLFDTAYNATWFSWIADASLADIRASYLNRDGLPLFPDCWMGPADTRSPAWHLAHPGSTEP